MTEPVIATILGIALLGERLTLIGYGGMALLVVALVILSLPTGERPRTISEAEQIWVESYRTYPETPVNEHLDLLNALPEEDWG